MNDNIKNIPIENPLDDPDFRYMYTVKEIEEYFLSGSSLTTSTGKLLCDEGCEGYFAELEVYDSTYIEKIVVYKETELVEITITLPYHCPTMSSIRTMLINYISDLNALYTTGHFVVTPSGRIMVCWAMPLDVELRLDKVEMALLRMAHNHHKEISSIISGVSSIKSVTPDDISVIYRRWEKDTEGADD